MIKDILPLLLFLFLCPAQADSLKVGLASVDITPPIGVPLAGYGGGERRAKLFSKRSPYSQHLTPSTGVRDPIQAKVLYIRGSDQKLLFVSLDMVGASRAMRADIISRLDGFGENEVFISGTHTHSGPGAFEKNWMWELLAADRFNEFVYEYIVAGVLRGIQLARLNAVPAEVFHVPFHVRDLQINRRNPSDHVDQDGHLILAKDRAGVWLGGMANLAIHGTYFGTSNLEYSADINGAMASALERKLLESGDHSGVKPVVLFINGAEGDVAPQENRSMEDLSESFASSAVDALSRARPLGEHWSVAGIDVSLGIPKVGNCARTKFGYALLQIGRPLLMTAFPVRSKLWSLKWGGIYMVTTPGEFTTDLGLSLRRAAREAGAVDSMVLGLTNDHLAYFVTPSEYWDGGYEACSSMFGEMGGMRFVEAYRHSLRPIYNDLSRSKRWSPKAGISRSF